MCWVRGASLQTSLIYPQGAVQGAEQQPVQKQSCQGGESTFLVPVRIWGVSQDPKGLMWHLGM